MFRTAFTLVELLAVMAIVGVLTALLLPAVMAAREASLAAACRNHLRQQGLALHAYHDSHASFPAGMLHLRNWTWRALLLPYLEEEAVHALIDFEAPSNCYALTVGLPPETNPAARRIDVLLCPSDPNAGNARDWSADDLGSIQMTASYLGVSGTEPYVCPHRSLRQLHFDGVLFRNSGVRLRHVTDGTTHTLAIGERGIPEGLYWGWNLCGGGPCAPGVGDMDATLSTKRPVGPGNSFGEHDDHFWSYHPSGAHFAFVDGSVRALAEPDHAAFRALSTRAGGEVHDD